MSAMEETSFKEMILRKSPGVGKRRFALLVCITISLLMMLPLAWLVRSSFMEMGQIFIFPPEWIPQPFRFENFPEALTVIPFFQYFLNTMLILVPSVVGTLVSCSLAAYGFSRLNWPGRDLVFGVLLSTLMLPYIITLLPTFLMWSRIGFIDTYVPLVVPHWLGFHVFFIFLLRQFFKNLPKELDEAAEIDGANPLQVFWYIILPVSRPVLLVVAILSGLNAWNDFLDPLVYINSSDKYTLALGLAQFTGLYTSQWNLLMAASTVIIVPVLIVFFLTQRYFIEGVTMSGLKG
ncbi:carbohydrate ABC transporter permease [Devosia nitrariae]|uniref:Sugar ABC transporter permease n=1 Tax=Devosia nitrariae TaxID=2071872 RepID=A0ABQ5W9H4_9HYPH|nr:carbohydrate ABC transporter permease [Devosia nitrariae]GLQ56200.1 sugar ABC transporter permease [Devosia nitrariae]